MGDISKLIEILKDENKIYNDILALANKKTEMIAEENMDEISNIAKKEEEYIKQAKLIEYKREDQITAIEKSLGIEKLSDISSLLQYVGDENIKKELIEAQKEFASTLNELKRVNLINNTLIQDALEYINLSVNLMMGATAEGTYGKDTANAEVQTHHKNMFDFKG